ncbi:redoxin domain-containing protein [Mucilaginibacter ximonensis]|uniref:Redoxin domain-containing protein n=1 Tax=Mucilaginibacter ximonensis TaxID=538021 RepID=A0ABW5YCU7_9SPHI
MKRYIFTALLLAPALLKAQTLNYIIKGNVANVNTAAKAFLVYRTDKGNTIDSAMVQGGKFEFKGSVADPTKATLYLAHNGESLKTIRKPDQLMVYLEEATIDVKASDSVKNATVTGSALNKANQELEATERPFNDKIRAIEAAYMALPKEQRTEQAMNDLEKKENSIEVEQKVALAKFIKNHPNTLLSLDALGTYGGYFPEASQIGPMFNSLSSKVKNSKAGKAYNKLLNSWKLTALGATAPQFSQNDKDGNAVSLASFKGKYVLIDFWASWCGPCRRENPNVVKAFNRFKGQNFTILGVSLDSKRENWLKAVADDHLDWTQVSDLQYWKNAVAAQYGVRAIPQNFLLDPNGKIIAKNLSGEALSAKLAELFPNVANVSGAEKKGGQAAGDR